MQKAVRINILARNSAAKSFQKRQHRKTRAEWKDWHEETHRAANIQNAYVREERHNRREDWMLGPLAPNRDSGKDKGNYGTVNAALARTIPIPKSIRAGPKRLGYAAFSERTIQKRGFKGDTIVGNVVSGDRVVIVAGPERLRGVIGVVNQVDYESERVRLTNINTTDIVIPNSALPEVNENETAPDKFVSQDVAIPMAHVRLVMTIDDEEGVQQDVIIRHLHAGPPYVQRARGSNIPAHTRYVSVSPEAPPIPLPWPEENITDDFLHFEGDSTRLLVQDATWVPGLSSSQLGYSSNVPSSVPIDSDPYSRAPELLGRDIHGVSGLDNIERAGLGGFVDPAKLQARQERIAQGIMDELRVKHKELNTRHDDAEWVKRKMIEDARAIWYQERQVVSPTVQAAEAEVQRRKKEREERIAREKEDEVELANLVTRLQKSPNTKFKPDMKMRKALARLAIAQEMQAVELAQKVAAE